MDRESSLCITNANINFPSDELLLNQSIKQLDIRENQSFIDITLLIKLISFQKKKLEILTLSTLNLKYNFHAYIQKGI